MWRRQNDDRAPLLRIILYLIYSREIQGYSLTITTLIGADRTLYSIALSLDPGLHRPLASGPHTKLVPCTTVELGYNSLLLVYVRAKCLNSGSPCDG
ncbi:hypothetical protein COCVIDRAFT_106006 [Bipolaris victoriae FI3]|uniref:Uncharacterized protein n=1 Tax=Bipolaris victoriae (strain FI3) TaxID=930091 RepID=W7EJN8_BIPV3|nr:hypothetical protein COCVIDRAFT_106006 [Bipolaris victoriae FI3]